MPLPNCLNLTGYIFRKKDRSPETIAAQFDAISDMSDAREMMTGNDHVMKIIQKATAGAKGIVH